MLVNWAVNMSRLQPVVFGVGLSVGAVIGAAAMVYWLSRPEPPALPHRMHQDRRTFRRAQTYHELDRLRNEARNGG